MPQFEKPTLAFLCRLSTWRCECTSGGACGLDMSRQKRSRVVATAAIAASDVLTRTERVCEALREIQWLSNCSTQTLQYVLDSLSHGKLGTLIKEGVELPRKVTHGDKKMQSTVGIFILLLVVFVFVTALIINLQIAIQAGEKAMILHGCVGPDCNKVCPPQDADDVCNLCGGPRYDAKGKPHEFIIHFPLKPRLESLLRCDQYCQAVQWEFNRKHDNDEYMAGSCVIYFVIVFNVS